jgi:uncharacterized protein
VISPTHEEAAVFGCAGETLIGMLHLPESRTGTALGVMIVVGGPQYRAGSHRQFVLLARGWADAGLPVFRFDCRGMGDSSGTFPGFERIGPDIAAAVDTFCHKVPGLKQVVLWGLCDGATAIASYAAGDPRVAGIVLVNPWVRNETSKARVHFKHYYVQRLADPDFRRKLIGGKFNMWHSARDLTANIRKLFSVPQAGRSWWERKPTDTLIERMAEGVMRYAGPVLIILSGQDLTAKEFADEAQRSERWRRLFAEERVSRHDLAPADHTFSRRFWREQVAIWTHSWLTRLGHN